MRSFRETTPWGEEGRGGRGGKREAGWMSGINVKQ